jgi:hypothetical protein
MDEHLDEKKCPVCGRPNLGQATKCWFCQAPLEEAEETHQNSLLSEDELLEQSGERSSFVQSVLEDNSKEKKDTAPEWLRRVRELIAADKKEEEPVIDWQQQQLFDESEKKEKKPPKTTPPATPNPAANVQKNPVKPASKTVEKKDDPPAEAKEELPDGFTPLSTHPNE